MRAWVVGCEEWCSMMHWGVLESGPLKIGTNLQLGLFADPLTQNGRECSLGGSSKACAAQSHQILRFWRKTFDSINCHPFWSR